MAAERPGEPDAIDMIDAEPFHEQRDAGIERRLGQLNCPDVGLGDLHLDRASMQQISESAAVLDDARRAYGQSAVEDAVLIDDAGEVHFRNDLDDAGSAHARDARGRRGLVESRVIGPQVGTYHLESRLQSLAVDAHAFDRSRRRALTTADLSAFEGGTGRAGTGNQAPAVPQHDFRVRA